ncbi:hypothetical protein DFH08DRAFT_979285 [Mycena albidolilacea]|uniref:Uncharacterized protein n=1 Tax=Mycena albidolilacea TaxID=1033008 RepID=A0AAD6YXH0_9AGAR|nr:hypothetical protein DFH08DRAFT_979285 [Mycena albidolilacea]
MNPITSTFHISFCLFGLSLTKRSRVELDDDWDAGPAPKRVKGLPVLCRVRIPYSYILQHRCHHPFVSVCRGALDSLDIPAPCLLPTHQERRGRFKKRSREEFEDDGDTVIDTRPSKHIRLIAGPRPGRLPYSSHIEARRRLCARSPHPAAASTSPGDRTNTAGTGNRPVVKDSALVKTGRTPAEEDKEDLEELALSHFIADGHQTARLARTARVPYLDSVTNYQADDVPAPYLTTSFTVRLRYDCSAASVFPSRFSSLAVDNVPRARCWLDTLATSFLQYSAPAAC